MKTLRCVLFVLLGLAPAACVQSPFPVAIQQQDAALTADVPGVATDAGASEVDDSAAPTPTGDADAAGAAGTVEGTDAAVSEGIAQADADATDAVDAQAPIDAADAQAPVDAADVQAPVDVADVQAPVDAVDAQAPVDAAPDAKPTCTAVGCDDGKPCTTDSCDAAGQCVHAVIAGCNDFAPACTATADCAAGKVCDPASHACVACLVAADCGPGHLCIAQTCVASSTCKSDTDCKSSGGVCDKADGVCADCNADTDCASAQACKAHVCIDAKPCKSSKECPGVCNQAQGVCVACLISDDCTIDKFCISGVCQADLCAQGQCVGAAVLACKADGGGYDAAKPCDDGNACTDKDACAGGACVYAAVAKVCDDGNPCTQDSCEPKLGCVAVANTAACDDGNACTEGDKCGGGSCAGVAKPCSDGNACTDDACQGGQCVFLANALACTDGSVCTTADKCAGGKCQPGPAQVCSDGNPCTADSCDPATGCLFTAAASAPCDDGNSCTLADSCATGTCKGTAKTCDDGNGCTDDACQAGVCVFTNNTAACGGSGACQVCQGGQCVAGGGIGLDKTFGYAANDVGSAIDTLAGGGYVLAGTTDAKGSGGEDGWILRVDANGNKLWDQVFGTSGADVFRGVLGLADGAVAVGSSQPPGLNPLCWAVRVDNNSLGTWNKTYPSSGKSCALWGATALADGFVLGGVVFADNGVIGRLIKTSSAGDTIWDNQYPETSGIYAVKAVGDGAVALGASGIHVTLLRVGPFGAVLWHPVFGGMFNDTAQGLAITADGGFALAGLRGNGFGGGGDFWLVRTDSAGNYLWDKTYPMVNGTGQATSVVALADGFALAGMNAGQNAVDGFIVRTDSTGKQLWGEGFGGSKADTFTGLAKVPGGLAAVGYTGSTGAGGNDVWLVRLDNAGKLGCACSAAADCDDQNACTSDKCLYGMCEHANQSYGTACGGGYCDGQGKCTAPACGNAKCEPGENANTCPVDCKPLCGNGVCESAGENTSSCPADCKSVCGNGVCENGESTLNCPTDCKAAAPYCNSHCGGSGSNGCYCDATCKTAGDCCNAAGTAKAGSSCSGSTCGQCN